jgi:hypothetical protein
MTPLFIANAVTVAPDTGPLTAVPLIVPLTVGVVPPPLVVPPPPPPQPMRNARNSVEAIITNPLNRLLRLSILDLLEKHVRYSVIKSVKNL